MRQRAMIRNAVREIRLFAALLGIALASAGRASAQALPPAHPDNAVWLPDYNELKNVPDFLAHMQQNGIRYLLPIDGGLRANGTYGGSHEFAAGYMNDIHDYEVRTSYKFKVLLFMVGDLTSTKPKYVNITDPAIRATIASECAKFTSSAAPGSFVAGAKRTFDGVVLDLEPGGVYRSTKPFQELGKAVRGAIGSDKTVAFYTPGFAAKPATWEWDRNEYYDMATSGTADFFMTATYGKQSEGSAVYQSRMREQVVGILGAVSGATFADGHHPAPRNGVKVFIGFPAFTHDHMIPDAAIAVKAALVGLDPVSETFLQGAHIFRQTNGGTDDGNASYEYDWANFRHYWLGADSAGVAALPISAGKTVAK